MYFGALYTPSQYLLCQETVRDYAVSIFLNQGAALSINHTDTHDFPSTEQYSDADNFSSAFHDLLSIRGRAGIPQNCKHKLGRQRDGCRIRHSPALLVSLSPLGHHPALSP